MASISNAMILLRTKSKFPQILFKRVIFYRILSKKRHPMIQALNSDNISNSIFKPNEKIDLKTKTTILITRNY